LKGYEQVCPLARAAEVLGERWTILILRAFLYGEQSFNSLRKSMTHISPTLLSERLKALEEHRILERVEADDKVYYRLTEAGVALQPVLMTIGEWGARYTPSNSDLPALDFGHVLWELPQRVDLTAFADMFSDERACGFVVAGASIPEFYLITSARYAKIVIKPPKSLAVPSTVRCSVGTLASVWVGDRTLDAVEANGDLNVEGDRPYWERVKSALELNLFARTENL
jgi:DNA-binding HxlR family transcriptional regulator